MEENPVRLHAVVEGRVQGVGFRAYVLEKADLLGAAGWVRNTGDGSVEVVAEGSQVILNDLLTFLRRGPRAALVTDVRQSWETATGEFSGFRVLSTAW